MKRKYFNNAYEGIMSKKTKEILEKYEINENTQEEINQVYKLSTKLINAKERDEMAFVESATKGFKIGLEILGVNKTDKIIVFSSEYESNLQILEEICEKIGCRIYIIECNINGSINLEDVRKAFENGGTILVASHVLAQGCNSNEVKEIGKIVKNFSGKYIIDGCQAVGNILVDVQEYNCDMYFTAGRKWLRGPHKSGILYIKKESQINRNSNIEFGKTSIEDKNEENIKNMIGFKNAIEECMNYGIENIVEEVSVKTKRIINEIKCNGKLILLGDSSERTGIIGFVARSEIEEELILKFKEKGFEITYLTEKECYRYISKINNVNCIFRISVHTYTDDDEIIELCKFIRNI